MTGERQFSEQQQTDIDDGIERVFAFVQDVVGEPSVLGQLPERATITLTPLVEKDASDSYATETHNFAVSVDLSGSVHRQATSA